MPLNDDLSQRMKSYERATRQVLPARSYTVIRLDGHAFHTYTRGLERPFDAVFAADMDAAAVAVATQVAGTAFAYVQSDEISVLVTDLASGGSQPWFGGVLAKLVSVTASQATATFNMRRASLNGPLALFDARAFTLPDEAAVADYFMWRQRDASRNSISMAASAHFSHGRLKGLNSHDKRELLASEAGIDWADYPDGFRQGRIVVREPYGTEPFVFTVPGSGVSQVVTTVRHRWTASAAPRFDTAPDGWLTRAIPVPRDATARALTSA